MKKPISYLLGSLAVAAVVSLAQPTPLPAQAPGEDSEMAVLLQEVITQQTTIVENHAKIDEKLGVIAEDVRQSRLFAARGGKGK